MTDVVKSSRRSRKKRHGVLLGFGAIVFAVAMSVTLWCIHRGDVASSLRQANNGRTDRQTDRRLAPVEATKGSSIDAATLASATNPMIWVRGVVRSGSARLSHVTVLATTLDSVARASTDEQGRFAVPLTHVGVTTFEVSGLIVVKGSPIDVEGPISDAEVVVEGDCAVAGRVLQLGKPVAEASVTLRPENATTNTDSRGQYTLPHLSPGSHVLSAVSTSLLAENRGIAVELACPDVGPIDIELDRGAAIAGQVVDKEGKAISSVRVVWTCSVCGDSQAAETQRDGSYRVHALKGNGSYGVEVRTQLGALLSAAAGHAHPIVTLRGPADKAQNIILSVDTDIGVLQGAVLDQHGGTRANIQVVVGSRLFHSQLKAVAKTTTDSQGRFVFDSLPVGEYILSAISDGQEVIVKNVAVGATDFRIVLPTTRTVRGKVFGFPSGRVEVSYLRDRAVETKAATDGTFAIEVPSGEQWLVAIGGSRVGLEQLQVNDGEPSEETSIDIRARDTVQLDGTVSELPSGKVATCTWSVQLEGFGRRASGAFSSDRSGVFSFDAPLGVALQILCTAFSDSGEMLQGETRVSAGQSNNARVVVNLLTQ